MWERRNRTKRGSDPKPLWATTRQSSNAKSETTPPGEELEEGSCGGGRRSGSAGQHSNPNIEARNSKQYQMTEIQNDQNQETPRNLSASLCSVWSLGIFEFRTCFGFRYSDFEFIQLASCATPARCKETHFSYRGLCPPYITAQNRPAPQAGRSAAQSARLRYAQSEKCEKRETCKQLDFCLSFLALPLFPPVSPQVLPT